MKSYFFSCISPADEVWKDQSDSLGGSNTSIRHKYQGLCCSSFTPVGFSFWCPCVIDIRQRISVHFSSMGGALCTSWYTALRHHSLPSSSKRNDREVPQADKRCIKSAFGWSWLVSSSTLGFVRTPLRPKRRLSRILSWNGLWISTHTSRPVPWCSRSSKTRIYPGYQR